MKRAMVIGAAIVLTLLIPSSLFGWGREGHEIVASLAQSRLTDTANTGIRSLIGDASLASISNWADDVRPDRDETQSKLD
jgi:S1/P1 Nuclease